MSSYQSRIPHFVKGKNEDEVRIKLINLAFQMSQKIEVMSIYPNANTGGVVAWYFHDIAAAPLPKEDTEAPKENKDDKDNKKSSKTKPKIDKKKVKSDNSSEDVQNKEGVSQDISIQLPQLESN